ncbi:acyl-CoA ligase (AMP-forming) (exosortase A-associated) [Sphingomonas zeicaulis]|uniref:AMP-binding protein n=1 Tax=Sphingomonas zeicaulis TaxID=1632740 RepID=UPI003D1EFA91
MNPLATTLHELFADNLQHRADKIFLIDADREASYAEVATEVDRVAAHLAAIGLQPGDRVVVQVRKGVREVAAMLGVAKIGAVVVNINTVWTIDQIQFVAEDCGARALIVEPAMARALTAAAIDSATPLPPLLVTGNGGDVAGAQAWDTLLHPLNTPVTPRLDTDLAAIIYTSGSTGKPKGVMLSHRNILAGARSVARYLQLGESDRLLSVLPYSFDYGFNQLTTMMLVGGTVVHQPVTLATEVARALQKHRITGFAAVPPLWIQLARLLEASPMDFPDLRYVTNSGGKIPQSVLERMPELFPGTEIVLMYGLTEAFRSTYLEPHRFRAKMGSIGRAIPGSEIYVIKAGVGIAGPGEQGELVHRGPLVSLGYWNRPEATAEKIRPCPELAALIGDEPVVYSGDVVRVDADGDLWFVSRNDALIKASGFRISPEEVEDLVHRSALAADVVAFGVADDVLGQCVHIAVTLLPGATSEALMAHCRQMMPAYMIPRQIHVWGDAMPRTASGKLARPDVVRRCASAPAAIQL